MNRRRAIGAVLVAVAALGAAIYAFAAPRAGAAGSATAVLPAQSMTISATGQKQGAFAKLIPIAALTHEIVSPRDAASGLPTGKRQHKPISISMQLGATTPRFITALVTNENLSSVQLRLLRNGVLAATIKLTNASVAHFVQGDQDVQFYFTYRKIEWTWTNGGISASDDWEAPVA